MNYLDATAAYASGEADWRQQLECEQKGQEMSFRDMYEKGKHLKAADLKGQMITVSIDKWEQVDFDDGPKLVIGFQGKEKTLVLNKTNYTAIADAYGDHPDMWKGKSITLFTQRVEFNGRQVNAIRVTLSQMSAQQPAPQPAPQAAEPAPDFDDDIPF